MKIPGVDFTCKSWSGIVFLKRFFLISFVLLLSGLFNFVKAQCPLVSTSCTGTPISGAANVTVPSGATYYVPTGQTFSGNITFADGTSGFCVQGSWTGTFAVNPPVGVIVEIYGSVNNPSGWSFSGGGAVFNVHPGATLTLSNFNTSNGNYTVNNCGTFVTNVDLFSTGGVFVVNNYGYTNVKGNLTSTNTNFTFNNKPGGQMYVVGSFSFGAGTYVNDGEFCVKVSTNFSGGIFINNKCITTISYHISGTNAFTNNYSVTVLGNFTNAGANTINNGNITVTGNFTNTGTFVLGSGSILTCVDWTSGGSIVGPASGCGSFRLTGYSSHSGSFSGNTGGIDIKDAGNPTPKGSPAAPLDNNTGNVGSATFTGTCTPNTYPACVLACILLFCPDIPDAGPDQTVCASTATLTGNVPSSGNGSWALVSGSGTITSPNNPTTGITGLGVGANLFTWTIVCNGKADTVVITRKDNPTTSAAGPDQTLCNVTSATLAGNTPASGTGTWTLISGTGTITTPTSPTSGVTGLGTGANVFRWTVSNPPCASSTDDVTITIKGIPTTATAGPDQSICATNTTLAGNTPVVGTGTWTLVSGTGTISNPTSPTSSVTGLGVGANVLRWTISNAPCASTSDDVTINVSANPSTANAGPDQLLCNVTTATITGNTPTSGVGGWTLVSGSGAVTSPASPTSGVTGLAIGPNVFRWTINGGACANLSDDVTITVSDLPSVATAGPDQSLCATATTLAGNIPTVGIGAWTLVSGAGTITTPSSPTSSVIGLGVGANIFRWTVSNPPCAATTDDVTINVSGNPTISDAGPDQSLCTSTTTLAGNTAVVGAGIWTLISGTGTITTPSSPTSGVTGLSIGPNVFRWTISNAPCTPTFDEVTITVSDFPTTAVAGPDQTICTNTAILAGNTPTVGTGTWTLVSGTGTIVNPVNPGSGLIGLGVGANVFRWTVNNPPCAVSTDEVTINVSDFPTTANAGPDQTICTNSATLAGNNPVVGTGTWTLVSGTGTITNPSSANSGVTGLGIGTNVFRWVTSNPPCAVSADSVSIIVKDFPTISDAGPDQTICATGTTLAGNTPVVGTGTWTLISGTGTITTPNSPTSGVTGLGVGNNVFRWTISNAPCAVSTNDVTITVSPNPTTSNAGPDQILCSTSTTAILSGNTPTAGTGTWTLISGPGAITNPATPTSGVTGLTIGTSVFRWTINSGACNNVIDDVSITVSAPLTASVVSKTDVGCYGDTTGAINLTVTGGTTPYTYSWTGGRNVEDPTGLTSGTYTVTVTDKTGCSGTTTVAISQPLAPIQITQATKNVTCAGSNNGTAAITATGGTPAYTYQWAPAGGTGATALNLSGGNYNYTVTVTDNAGCSKTTTFRINESAALLTASITNNKAVTCAGSKDGALTVTPTGGTTPYTFSWQPTGGTSATASGLSGGAYTVTVSDTYGCSAVVSTTINESATQLTAGITNNKAVTCKGSNDGTATATPLGGTVPYTYLWSPTGGTASTATGLAGGNYTVSISDAYGCDTTLQLTIKESAKPFITSIAGTDAGCNNNIGTVMVSDSGGTAPVTYQWSPGVSTSSSATGLAGGIYSVTVTDLYGCSSVLTTTVTSKPRPIAGFTPSPATGTNPLTVTFTNTSTGGTTYSWYFGDGMIDSTFNTTHIYDNPGTYTVKLVVKNNFGCMDSAIYTFIKVNQKSMISIPNIFTPNGDNKNEIFYIKSKGLTTLEVQIYNRWGMKLYEFNTVNGSWDGRNAQGSEAPDGTYYYILKATGEDGVNYNQQGFLTLIR